MKINELLKINNIKYSIKKENVIKLIEEVMNLLFLGYYEEIYNIDLYIKNKSNDIIDLLKKLNIKIDIINEFINQLPIIKNKLNGDIKAFLSSDPSVESAEEIILCYPGFYAICLYRIANCLSNLNISLIPRIITEYAHSITGIDIHPKAIIKENFFIDHGTGIVIGETAIIGSNVKIYHGVTLGALSLNNIENLKNNKRHPTIEDNVVIYSGATILGGATKIGKSSIIGSNVFITKSIESNSKVIFTNYEQLYKIKEI